jgi:hypothetical protein
VRSCVELATSGPHLEQATYVNEDGGYDDSSAELLDKGGGDVALRLRGNQALQEDGTENPWCRRQHVHSKESDAKMRTNPWRW